MLNAVLGFFFRHKTKTKRIIKWMRQDPELNKLLVFLENQLGKPAEQFIALSLIKDTWSFQKGYGGGSNPLFKVPYPPRADETKKFYFAHEIGHFLYTKKNKENFKISLDCCFGEKRERGMQILSCFWNEVGAWKEAGELSESQGLLLTDEGKKYFYGMNALSLLPKNYSKCFKAMADKKCPLFY